MDFKEVASIIFLHYCVSYSVNILYSPCVCGRVCVYVYIPDLF